MRRGQVTILIIVAAMVLFSAMFAFYMVERLTPNTANDALASATPDGSSAKQCLEDAGKSAIMQALSQGGVNEEYWKKPGNVETNDTGSRTRPDYDRAPPEIGESAVRGNDYEADGITPDAPAPKEYIEVNGVPVRFWIFRGKDYLNYWPPGTAIPEYPPVGVIPTPDNGPYLGQVIIEPLCSFRGFNGPGASLDGSNSCLPGTYKVRKIPAELKSWQEALGDRITATVKENSEVCNLPAPVVVALGENDVTLISGNETVTIPIRLKRMYNLAYNLAKREASDINFDPNTITGTKAMNDATKVKILGCQDRVYGSDCAIPGLQVTTTKAEDSQECLDENDGACQSIWNPGLDTGVYENTENDAWRQKATIVTIEDLLVKIDNKHPKLRFAIKNRYPIATGGGGSINEITQTSGKYYAPKGIDVDNTELTASCYTSDSNTLQVVPECTGAIDKELGAELFQMESTDFCNANRPKATCSLTSDCTEAVPTAPVYAIICSKSDQQKPTDPVTGQQRLVPPNWMTWTTTTAVFPNNDIPRNCRLEAAPATVECRVDYEMPTSKSSDCGCKTYGCPSTPTCKTQYDCIEPWGNNEVPKDAAGNPLSC